jgi:hypothetical protein
MATRALPILRAVTLAYEDLWRVWRAMPMLIACALLIALAAQVLEEVFPLRVIYGAISGHFLGIAIGALQSFCLTPILIAMHRFIVLEEVPAGYAVDPTQPSFIAFFSWLIALSLMSASVFAVPELLTAFAISAKAALGPMLMVAIVMTIVTLRLAILFPAIAVGARGATAAHALADSKGHVLSIFLVFLLTLLPMVALAVAVTLTLGRGAMVRGSTLDVVGMALGSSIHTVVLILVVAVASRLFQAIGERLLRQQA